MDFAGDVLSGTSANNIHHKGVMEEWFGQHWWTSRISLMLLTTLFIFAPLISFKRVGKLATIRAHTDTYIFTHLISFTLYDPNFSKILM